MQPCLSPFNMEAAIFSEKPANMSSVTAMSIAIPGSKADGQRARLAWQSAARNKSTAVLKGKVNGEWEDK